MSETKPELDDLSDMEDIIDSDDQEERDQARQYVCSEITRYAVEILEFYSKSLGKNEALGLTIESLSESLGNLISLVHENNQSEVLEASQCVIHQGMINQAEMIATICYGQVGHA